jgi:diguanylate cyclase (GGDEF)-like protein
MEDLGQTRAAKPSERPQPSKEACFVVMAGPRLGVQIACPPGKSIVIGRDPGCEFPIDDDKASRRHARIDRIAGLVAVTDLKSTNGTWVNDARVTDTQSINDGDLVKIGSTVLKFLASGSLEAAYHQQIYDLVTLDPLTGAHNKRHFHDVLERALSRADAELSLIVFDIDHFKRINDTRGHPAGDAVLQRLGQTVRALVPQGGMFARVGGEEFAVMLNGADASQAFGFAEYLRATVQGTQFDFQGAPIPVTISVGVAERAGGGALSGQELFQRADVQLYRAKQGGRNRVCREE